MHEKEFCLLHEPWILVMKSGGSTEEVSLLDLFRRAPEFLKLAGELPTQDVAILRLLLAILHAVFGRYDTDGSWSPLTSPEAALKRWKKIWDEGTFPMEIIKEYLMNFEDRFWLFHPETPFYQVADLANSTEYTAAKLNGEVSESNNKVRLFPQRTGDAKTKLSYSEAARWLLYVNAFDDTSAKPKKKGLPSPGAGWLGKLGLIMAVGDNVFQTLMLNLVFLKDGGQEVWEAEKPVWEAKTVKCDERSEIPIPNNPSELLTLQSRRLLLKRQDKVVIGYRLLGGDFFQKEGSLNEQMTVWKVMDERSQEIIPRRHDPSRQLWRSFSALVEQSETQRRPGIVNWLATLKIKSLIPYSHFYFQICGIKYGDKDFFVDDVFADEISFNANLLTVLGEEWTARIIGEIEYTEQLVQKLGWLAKDLAKASGDDSGKYKDYSAREQAYFRLDTPFRRWLEQIDPVKDSEMRDEICSKWREEAKRVILGYGRELVEQSGMKAFVGRKIKEKIKGKEVETLYAAPMAYNRFLSRV